MAVVMITDLISEDIWTLPEAHVDIRQLQVRDFTKWVRKQVRQFGRTADICNQQYSAVEMWMQELGIEAGFIAGGEVDCNGHRLFSGFQASGYYMFNEAGMMETKSGRWLAICAMEDQESYLIGR